MGTRGLAVFLRRETEILGELGRCSCWPAADSLDVGDPARNASLAEFRSSNTIVDDTEHRAVLRRRIWSESSNQLTTADLPNVFCWVG